MTHLSFALASLVQEKFGERTEHSAMGMQVPMPPEGHVFDFMFDYDNIR
jgi:hypothetical protein